MVKQITKRLLPWVDLGKEIENLVKENEIKAGVVLSLVGSLSKLKLRVAGGKTVKEWEGKFEIVSVTGTLSQQGCHIHISASDKSGKVIGGHLKEGCIVRTTVELVVLVFEDVEYKRKSDENTGYKELEVD